MLSAREEAILLERLRAARAGTAEATPTLQEAEGDLFAPYQPRLRALCQRIVGDPQRAEEIAQDAMLLAWQKIPEFEGRSRFSTFLHGIARNLCFHAIRRKQETLTADGIFDVKSEEATALARMGREERRALVALAIKDLDPIDQEAVMLRYAENLPYDAIERVLDLDRSVMKSGARGVLQRCKRTFQRAMRERMDELGVGSSFLWTGTP